jgi:alpha/beta hydrolase fold
VLAASGVSRGGFPASSHQFRNLIPALADRFDVLSPDYPGFGNTDMPDPATWNYTFDHLAEIVDGLLTSLGAVSHPEPEHRPEESRAAGRPYRARAPLFIRKIESLIPDDPAGFSPE